MKWEQIEAARATDKKMGTGESIKGEDGILLFNQAKVFKVSEKLRVERSANK